MISTQMKNRTPSIAGMKAMRKEILTARKMANSN